MREDLLHFIWKYKKLQLVHLYTSKGARIQIHDFGTHNHLAGPDFFNAKLEIDGQLWAGNVEIHQKSSDWYAHHHEQDPNYNNVILHVVWENDSEVFRRDNSQIPTLALKNYIPFTLLKAYKGLFEKREKTFINCENEIARIDSFSIKNWLERIFFERLERKTDAVITLLENSQNNWEQVLFSMLIENFGLNLNGAAFRSLAKAIDFSIVRKLHAHAVQLESVLYGLSHLLEDECIVDAYYQTLKKEYRHQKNKFNLVEEGVLKPNFFKLRPANFPTIRLSQFASVYVKHQNLFQKVIGASTASGLYSIFEVSASSYWNNHYTFGTTSKVTCKNLNKKFIDLLIINTILPLKLAYAKQRDKFVEDEILHIISQLKAEKNSIVNNFVDLGVPVKNAQNSQAVLQLYTYYCTKNRCLECLVGCKLLGK